MKKKLSFIAVFMLPLITVLAGQVNFDLSNTDTYSLTSNLTATYDAGTGTLWLTHSGSGGDGVFTLEAVEDVSTYSLFTFGYDQTGNGGKVKYQAGNGTAFQPYGTVKKDDATIPGTGGSIGTSGKFIITIFSTVTLQDGYSGHVGIKNFSGMEKEILPEGYVSFYTVATGSDHVTELAGTTVAAGAEKQFAGPPSWGGSFYDVSNYGKLVFKITFDAADAGKQVGLRYYAKGAVQKTVITYPTEGTTHLIEIDLQEYVQDGKVIIGGGVFYNGKTHWDGISYTNAATQSATINYIALEIVQPESLAVVPDNETLAQALPVGQSTTLKAQFTPSNTTNQAVTWSSADTDIATVDASTGVVTGVADGSVAITATSVEVPSISGDYEVTVTTVTTDVESVELNTAALDLKLLNTATLAYTVLPLNATDQTVTWSSTDETVATVAGGTITPVSSGTTDIIIETVDGNFKDTCAVTVIGFEAIPEGYVSLYTLDYMNNGVLAAIAGSDKGATNALPAIFSSNGNKLLGNPSNWNRNSRYVDLSAYDELEVACYFQTADIGKTIDVRYCFSAPSLESDQSAGTTIKDSAVVITDNVQKFIIDLTSDPLDTEGGRRLGAIYFRNNGASGTISFNVDYVAIKKVPPTGLTVEPEDAEVAAALPIGESTTLTAVFDPINTANKAVIWSTVDTDIATVDATTGVVTGVSAGTAVITATSVEDATISGDYEVTVVAIDATGVEFDLESLNLKMLNTATLAYTVSPADASNKNITWTSSEPTVATVDEAGIITPISAGTTDIIIETADGAFKDTCAVTVIGIEPIPAGYVSLYSLNYVGEDGIAAAITGSDYDATHAVPAIFSSNGNKLLGASSDWNRNTHYVDLAAYNTLEIACYFQTSDTAKIINVRYCFAAPSLEADQDAETTVIDSAIVITDNVHKFIIDLVNDALDTEKARRLGAIHFGNHTEDGDVNFNVDYVALKPTPTTTGIKNTRVEELPAFVNVYAITGQLIKKNVAREAALNGLANGVYIVNNQKRVVANRK